MLDWLRLFDKTSFYIRLIQETISDILYFMIIFVAALWMFGNTMYMLQLNKDSDADDIVTGTFGHFMIDSLYNQYLLSLGEFAMDGFDDHPEMSLVYIFFTLATFFTQVTFLNMLIAIMGDTFGRVIENKANFGLQTKLSIMGDYTAVIDKNNSLKARCCKKKFLEEEELDNKNYLFVVKPKSDGDDDA